MTALAIFDVDGTLLELGVDIEPARAGIAALFAARGFAEEMRPILPQIGRAAAAVAESEEDRRRLVAEARGFIDRAELAAAAHAVIRPGAQEVARWAAAGHPVALVTDNGRAAVLAALSNTGLEALAQRATLVSRDDVELAKPDPEGLLLAIARVGWSGPMVYAGDSERDMAAGRAAARHFEPGRLTVIGIVGGRSNPHPEALRASGSDRQVAGPAEVLLYL